MVEIIPAEAFCFFNQHVLKLVRKSSSKTHDLIPVYEGELQALCKPFTQKPHFKIKSHDAKTDTDAKRKSAHKQ